MNKLRVLSLYRSKLSENRGTPIRVRSILQRLDVREDVELAVCSWDEQTTLVKNHTHLTNNHWQDIKTILALVREKNIDIVLGHTIATGYYLLPVVFFTRAKIVLEMHGFIEEEAKLYGTITPVIYWLQKILFGIVYRLCDAVTTCSDTATDILLQYNKRTLTIFGGADPEIFNPQVASGNYFTRAPGQIIIGYAGNSRVWQGLPFLAEAFAVLHAAHPEYKLVVVSSESKHPNMGTGVEIIGPLNYPDVPRALIDCDILVIPRPDNEVNRISFPSKLVEYLAMGKAVVASRTSDCDKIIKNEYNGLLYDPGDLSGLANCFLRLAAIDDRAAMGYHAVDTVAKFLTWDIQVDKLIKLLKSL